MSPTVLDSLSLDEMGPSLMKSSMPSPRATCMVSIRTSSRLPSASRTTFAHRFSPRSNPPVRSQCHRVTWIPKLLPVQRSQRTCGGWISRASNGSARRLYSQGDHEDAEAGYQEYDADRASSSRLYRAHGLVHEFNSME